MNHTLRPWRGVGRTLVCAAGALLTGCGSSNSTATLEQGLNHYQARRYSLARQEAIQVRDASTGTMRTHAAYLAGLSAYRLGELDEARPLLSMASASDDPGTAGRASAQLGLIDLEQNHPASAARYFETAATKLDGAAATNAAQHAAMAHQIAGDFGEAQRWLAHTGPRPTSSIVPARYVLQAGAFQSRTRAEQTAREIEPIAESLRLGPVRVVLGPTSRGNELHLVQFGGFQHSDEANRARAGLGRLEVIVVSTR